MIFVNSLQTAIFRFGSVVASISKNNNILWVEIKKTDVQTEYLKSSMKSPIPFFVLGTNPRNLYSFMGIEESWRALVIDEAPGIIVTYILFKTQCLTSLYPGSDIRGEPASEIRDNFLLSKWSLIFSITLSSL